MKKTMVLFVLASMSLALMARDEGQIRRYENGRTHKSHRVYFYAMGSHALDLFPEGRDFSAFWDQTGWGPTVGAGCRLLNFQDTLCLHVEYDYATYKVANALKFHTHTLMFPIVMSSHSLRPFSFQVGLGVSWLNFRLDKGRQVLEITNSTLAASLGGKARLADHICLRAEVRVFWDNSEETNRATIVSAGVEVGL